MIRKSGRDPGIHIHTDVTDYDIWKNLREERADLRESTAAATSALTEAKYERAQKTKRASKA